MRAETTIGCAAERAGVGIETIRFYERRGLIPRPPRPRGGYRSYGNDIVERIRFIREAQALGFTLHEIAELLSLRADPDADCSRIRAQAAIKREEVGRKIAQLRRMKTALDALIAACPGGGAALRGCTIIDAMAGRHAAKTVPPSGKTAHGTRGVKGHDMKTAAFKIEGMHCEGCARTVEALVSAEPGVCKTTVSWRAGKVRIVFDPGAGNEDRFAAAIRKAGYTVAREAS